MSVDEAVAFASPLAAAAEAMVRPRVSGRRRQATPPAGEGEIAGPDSEIAARRESDLVERARAGNVDAYEKLIGQYERFAYRVAYVITRDAGDAEEATQDAFIKAYKHLSRFRRGAPFKPWLLKIVSNEARSRRRSRQRHGEIAARAIGVGVTTATGVSAEGSLLLAEQRRLLLAAIDSLPENMRAVVTCRYLLELSEAETAAALGIRLGTAKSRLSRALDRLETRLAGEL
jgi:RNA polymerase sigma-70 factor (ECF subfamily)